MNPERFRSLRVLRNTEGQSTAIEGPFTVLACVARTADLGSPALGLTLALN
jgi:hypothetical protein